MEYEDEEYSDYGMIEKQLRRLTSQAKNRRLEAKLSRTDGRTPEEAATFAAKAQSLGSGE